MEPHDCGFRQYITLIRLVSCLLFTTHVSTTCREPFLRQHGSYSVLLLTRMSTGKEFMSMGSHKGNFEVIGKYSICDTGISEDKQYESLVLSVWSRTGTIICLENGHYATT